MSDQVAWGDTLATWPSLSVEVEFMPWHWRLGWWRRDGRRAWLLRAGPLTVESSANRPLFPVKRRAVSR